MNYVALDDDKKTLMLLRLYKRLNKRLYNNSLTLPEIQIADVLYTREKFSTCWAGFKQHTNSFAFSRDIEKDFIEYRLSIEDQKRFLCAMMLHEMAHQYCFANKIDDSYHCQEWQDVANSHGLELKYTDGVCEYERLSTLGIIATVNFRIY